MNGRRIRRFQDAARLAAGAAEEIVLLNGANEATFTVALAVLETTRSLYAQLAGEYRESIEWGRIELFWGDERFVPRSSPSSNYFMVRETLIDRVAIPSEHLHPVPVDLPDPASAAREYDALLRSRFPDIDRTFDLTILGLGEDGHTASLFPGGPELEIRDRYAVASVAPVEPRDRVTLTLPALNGSRNVIFLAAGNRKRTILTEILGDNRQGAGSDPLKYPAAMIRPDRPVQWFVDAEAYPDE